MRSALLIVISLVPAAALADEPASLYHVPAAEAQADTPVVIEATIQRAWQATLELRYRAIGGEVWRSEAFQRGNEEDHYQAVVPPDFVKPPGFEYYIVGTDKAGQTSPHFASEGDPHQVAVPEEPAAVLRNQELARVHNRKARFQASGEYVDFGTRTFTLNGAQTEIPDYYYRVEGDFTYRLMRFPLYQLRFGVMRLLGVTPSTVRGEGDCSAGPSDTPGSCKGRAGVANSGWFEVRLRASSLLDVDLRGIVAATKSGFSLGARAELRAGPEFGSHLAVGFEAIPETGFNAFVRLAWDTVPQLPMAATIEITDYPASHRATAVRLIYDVAHPFANGIRVGLRGGYQARDEGIGGATGGLNASYEF